MTLQLIARMEDGIATGDVIHWKELVAQVKDLEFDALGIATPITIENERWHDLSLTVTRDRAEMTLDGKKVSDAQMEYLPSFFAIAGYDRKGQRVVLKTTNYHRQSVQAEIQFEGAGSVSATGQHIVIRAALSRRNSRCGIVARSSRPPCRLLQ